MQVIIFPRLQFMVMPVALLKLTKGLGVGYFAAIAMLNSKVIV